MKRIAVYCGSATPTDPIYVESARAVGRTLAERGILVAPGDFYGPGGAEHVRIGLTAPDERVAEAARRITGLR